MKHICSHCGELLLLVDYSPVHSVFKMLSHKYATYADVLNWKRWMSYI